MRQNAFNRILGGIAVMGHSVYHNGNNRPRIVSRMLQNTVNAS